MEFTKEDYWVTGLLEGEGSFITKPNGGVVVCCTLTDLDILEKLQNLQGGTIITIEKRASHHKDCWRWNLYGSSAYNLTKKIVSLLGKRRQEQANKLIQTHESSFRYLGKQKQKEVKRLREEEGLLHREIAEQLGIDRSYVSHILAGNYD